MKTKKKSVDQATPVMPEFLKDTALHKKITSAYALITAIKNSAEWPAALGVQTATLAWSVDTDALNTNDQSIADLVKQLAALRANKLVLLRRWNASKLGVTTAVRAHSDGSKDKVLSFGMNVAEKTSLPEATVVQELRGKRSKTQGHVAASWKPQRGVHDYMVQYCTDPTDPETYSVPVICSKASFELRGQTPGALIHFRVLAIDAELPGGQTDYTAWVGVMVSSG